MKLIPLTQNQFAIVDDDKFEELNKFKWYAFRHGYTFYPARKVNGQVFFMHNYLMKPPEGFEVDHKNHNGLDCQLLNLRNVTHQQNTMNRRFPKPGSSKFIGVSWHKKIKKWQVQIQCNKKNISYGYFNDEIEAAKHRDLKAKELFGEHVVLNFSEAINV